MNKMKFVVFAFLAMFTTTVVGCSDDDDNPFVTLPADVQKAFNDKYPDTRVEGWERKNSYYVIEFEIDRVEAEAWFENHVWKMTERDLRYENLPAAVAQAFKASAYADWKIDDIDVVERYGMPTLYIIEVEKGKQEVELYYFEDGKLLKEIVDTDDDDSSYLPQIPNGITAILNEMYPGAIVLDFEFEKGEYEVEIVYENKKREVVFDRNFKWVYTKWDSKPGELSDAVINFIENNYPGYEIDDVEVVHSYRNNEVYFVIELEKGESEIEIKIKANGELVR